MFGGDGLFGVQFGTLAQTFDAQLSILLGKPPESYDQDMRMTVYVVLVFVILFFLMLNFLFAIVIDGIFLASSFVAPHYQLCIYFMINNPVYMQIVVATDVRISQAIRR